jgi:hypothetical protein
MYEEIAAAAKTVLKKKGRITKGKACRRSVLHSETLEELRRTKLISDEVEAEDAYHVRFPKVIVEYRRLFRMAGQAAIRETDQSKYWFCADDDQAGFNPDF